MSWISRMFKLGTAESKTEPIGWTTDDILAMSGDGAPHTWLGDHGKA